VTEKRLTPIARKLRANQTDAEERLWQHLRGRRLEGEKFVRQFQNAEAVLEAIRQELLVARNRPE
jgi:very-short-patch-repair endonuclease